MTERVTRGLGRLAAPTSWPLLAAAAVVIALGTSAVHSLGDSDELVAQRWQHTEVLLGVERLLGTLADAESGQRGYLLTGRPAYLEPYGEAGRQLRLILAELEGSMADEPEQLERVHRLRPLIQERLGELSRTIELRREGRLDDVLSLVGTDQGRFTMVRLREEAKKLTDRATALRDERNRQYISTIRRSFFVVVGGSAVLFVLTAYATMTTARELRARGLAEIAARHRGERYRSLVDASSQVIWTADCEGEMVGEQPGWSELTGQSAANAAGLGWLEAVHPNEREATRVLWRAAVASRRVFALEHRVRRSDGTWRDFAVRAVPVLDETGGTREWVAVHTDITERKRGEARLKFLADLSTVFASERELEAALGRVAALSLPTFADWCAIDLADGKGGIRRVSVGFADERRRALGETMRAHPPAPDEAGGIAEVFRTGRSILCSEVARDQWKKVIPDEARRAALEALGIGSFVIVPFWARGEVAGVLSWAYAESGRRYEGEDLAFAHEVASRTGFAVDRERLLAETNTALERELTAGRATEAARRLLDAIFEAAPVGLVLFDEQLRVARGNAALAAITGRPEEAHVGLEAGTLFPALEPSLPEVLAATRARRAPVEAEVRAKTAGGEERFWLARCSPAEDAGVIAVLIDITDRKRADAERERLVRALAKSNQDLNDFAYVASHDLKAPLRGITHLSEWLEEDLGPGMTESAREKLHLLRGRAHRLEGLIEGILNYSRAGRARSELGLVDVRMLLKEVVDLLGRPALESVEIAEGPWPTLRTEKAALEQVFMNLISNAIKHATPIPDAAGQGRRRIELSAVPDGPFWRFCVADNGPGIAPEYHERIWGIFQMLQARDKVEGAGIGLAIVKKIVEAKGGRAWVESAPQAGAKFWFTWPDADGDVA